MSALDLTNAMHTASSRADDFFKEMLGGNLIALESCMDRETGNVEWHGWFATMEVTREDVMAYVSCYGDPWISEHRNLNTGWYIVKQNNDGLVWAFAYASKGLADVDFEKIEALYAEESNDHLSEDDIPPYDE